MKKSSWSLLAIFIFQELLKEYEEDKRKTEILQEKNFNAPDGLNIWKSQLNSFEFDATHTME